MERSSRGRAVAQSSHLCIGCNIIATCGLPDCGMVRCVCAGMTSAYGLKDATEEGSLATIRRARELGVTLLDTAGAAFS